MALIFPVPENPASRASSVAAPAETAPVGGASSVLPEALGATVVGAEAVSSEGAPAHGGSPESGNLKPETSARGRESGKRLDDPDLTALFTHHRTPQGFSARPVESWMLRRLYDLAKLGPTSGNCSPARIVFLTSQKAREKLQPALSAGNVARALQAPVVAVLGYDPMFFEELPKLSPVEGLREWFAADVGLSEETAFRNGTLQGAYLLMAARALGLAALPLSGFDALSVEEKFFAPRSWRANFLIALGYPQEDQVLPPRAPRLGFDEACECL